MNWGLYWAWNIVLALNIISPVLKQASIPLAVLYTQKFKTKVGGALVQSAKLCENVHMRHSQFVWNREPSWEKTELKDKHELIWFKWKMHKKLTLLRIITVFKF